jgi:hypothetical protein
MEIPAPSSLEASGGGGEESAAPTRNGVSGQTGDALEGDGDKGVESVAMESDGADPGAAAPQIHEPRPDRKTCHQVSEPPSPVSHPLSQPAALRGFDFVLTLRCLSQCRQGKSYFGAACKVEKKYGLCKLRYCRKCLINRYTSFRSMICLGFRACLKLSGSCFLMVHFSL